MHVALSRGLVLVALVIASTAVGTAWAQRHSDGLPVKGGPITGAIYLRDASGRCLRLQTTLAADGTLMVLPMPNEACATREQTPRP